MYVYANDTMCHDPVSDAVAGGSVAVSGDEVADGEEEEEEEEPAVEEEHKTDAHTQPGEHRLITTAWCTLNNNIIA